MSTSLLVSTGAVSCYPASMVNLIWFSDSKKMFIVSALSNMGAEVRGLLRQKLNHLASSVCWCFLSCSNIRKSNYPHRHVNTM